METLKKKQLKEVNAYFKQIDEWVDHLDDKFEGKYDEQLQYFEQCLIDHRNGLYPNKTICEQDNTNTLIDELDWYESKMLPIYEKYDNGEITKEKLEFYSWLYWPLDYDIDGLLRKMNNVLIEHENNNKKNGTL